MANAKKCDRCGAYYDDIHRDIAKVRTLDSADYWKKQYDLCEHCTLDFERFIKGTALKEE